MNRKQKDALLRLVEEVRGHQASIDARMQTIEKILVKSISSEFATSKADQRADGSCKLGEHAVTAEAAARN